MNNEDIIKQYEDTLTRIELILWHNEMDVMRYLFAKGERPDLRSRAKEILATVK